MSETKWTPGPWKVAKSDAVGKNGNFGMVLHLLLPDRTGDDALMSVVTYGRHMPTVSLVVAAPDLYEALAELVGRRERACREAGGNLDGSDGRYARARAALAKARGETP